MSNKNESAFPTVDYNVGTDNDGNVFVKSVEAKGGLTKREYFAIKALQGLLANSIPGNHHIPDTQVGNAVDYADRLLAELKRTS